VLSVVFTAFLALSGRSVTAAGLALYFWYVVHYLVMVVGISLAGSVLLLRYRDLDQVWDVVTQAGFFLAPIIWPINVLPERLHFYFFLWPPTAIIQFSRAVLVDTTAPTLKAHVLLSLEAAVIFAMGTLVFRRYAPRAAEYL
jgi:lipopolysaccharide transport system permease protein